MPMMDSIPDPDHPYATGRPYILVTYFRGYYRTELVFPDGRLHAILMTTRGPERPREEAQVVRAWCGYAVVDDVEAAKARDDAQRYGNR